MILILLLTAFSLGATVESNRDPRFGKPIRGDLIFATSVDRWGIISIGDPLGAPATTYFGGDGTDVGYRTLEEMLSDLSGEATTTFSWNSQGLSDVGNIIFDNDARTIGSATINDLLTFGDTGLTIKGTLNMGGNDITSVGNLTVTATIEAEHLHSTDDLVVDDRITMSGVIMTIGDDSHNEEIKIVFRNTSGVGTIRWTSGVGVFEILQNVEFGGSLDVSDPVDFDDSLHVQENITIGEEDSNEGLLTVFANTTTGAKIKVHVEGNSDATIVSYDLQTFEDDFYIGSDGDIDMLKFIAGTSIQSTVPFDVDAAFTATTIESDGAVIGTSLTDGATTITGGNYTGVVSMAGDDLDISAGTGRYDGSDAIHTLLGGAIASTSFFVDGDTDPVTASNRALNRTRISSTTDGELVTGMTFGGLGVFHTNDGVFNIADAGGQSGNFEMRAFGGTMLWDGDYKHNNAFAFSSLENVGAIFLARLTGNLKVTSNNFGSLTFDNLGGVFSANIHNTTIDASAATGGATLTVNSVGGVFRQDQFGTTTIIGNPILNYFGGTFDGTGKASYAGAGTPVTTSTGGRFTAGNADTNIGIDVTDVSGGTNNIAIRTGTGDLIFGGDMFFTGDGGFIEGHMTIPGVDIVVDTSGTTDPVEIADDGTGVPDAGDGWASVYQNETVFAASDLHYITITIAGTYEVIWDMSPKTAGGGGTEIHGGIMIDGVAVRDNGENHAHIFNTNDNISISSVGVIDCPNGDEEISLWVANNAAQKTAVEHSNMRIQLIGGT